VCDDILFYPHQQLLHRKTFLMLREKYRIHLCTHTHTHTHTHIHTHTRARAVINTSHYDHVLQNYAYPPRTELLNHCPPRDLYIDERRPPDSKRAIERVNYRKSDGLA